MVGPQVNDEAAGDGRAIGGRGREMEDMVVTELIKPLYTAVSTAVGGRDGHARSSGGDLDVDLRPPVAMGGQGGGTNPEELFATGFAACFQSALAVVARRQKVSVEDSTVTGKVTIGTIEGGAFGLAVELEVHIPDVDQATTESLMAAAHQVCPYSNATRGNIAVTLSAV